MRTSTARGDRPAKASTGTPVARLIAGASGALWAFGGLGDTWNGIHYHALDPRTMLAAGSGVAVAAECVSRASGMGPRVRLRIALAIQIVSMGISTLHEWGHLYMRVEYLWLFWVMFVILLEVWFTVVAGREAREASGRK